MTDGIRDALTTVGDYAEPAAMGAGAVGLLLALWAFRRYAKGHAHPEVVSTVGVLLMGVVTTEGMWVVVHDQLHVTAWLTVLMFAAFDVVIYAQGLTARAKLQADPGARVGSYLTVIWVMSTAMAFVASSASGNATTTLFRLFAPFVAAMLWTQTLMALRPRGTRQASAWIWTPQRIGIHLGLLKPGSGDDLAEVFRARRVDRMVALAGRLDTGGRMLRGRRVRRLRRLAQGADARMIGEVRERYQRGATICAAIFADHADRAEAPAARPEPAREEPAQPARPAVAHLIAQPDAPRRTRAVVMRRPVSAPPDSRTDDEREQALRSAADAVAQGTSKRQAARDYGVPESTLRAHLSRLADAKPINSYDLTAVR